jgi:glucokinase
MTESDQKTGAMIGVELSGDLLRGVILAADGAIAGTRELPVSVTEDRLAQLSGFINGLKTQAPTASCVGIAVPGLVEMRSGRVALSRHLPEHESMDMTQAVSQATGLKINLENDANAAAYAEFKLGAGRGAVDMFYVTLGKGVGGALILDGKLWLGAAGFAGEFGYVTINSEGLRVEDMASADNIVRRTRDRLHQDSTTSLQKIAEEKLSVTDIVSAANADDDFANMMLERTGMFVGTAVASVINLLNIERVVIGGEVMAAGNPVVKGVTDRAREFSFAPGFAGTSIVAGELGINAAAIGAALLSCAV